MPQQSNHQWLAAAPFTLALSAGFFGFYAHTGLLQALAASGLKPRRIVGVSAGALAGGIYASGVPLEALEEALVTLKRQAFWDVGRPALQLAAMGLLEGRKFAQVLDDVLSHGGVETLEACPIPFTPVVFDVVGRQTVGLQDGPLGDAIRASCALPGLFRPVDIHGRLVVDGGVRDRGGHTAVAEGERTLAHHLPSHSPWRFVLGTAPKPDSQSLRTVILPPLPRVGPFALGLGAQALRAAREATTRWLGEPTTMPPTNLGN